MDDPAPQAAQWPLQLARLQTAMLEAAPDGGRDVVRGAFWRLLFEALLRHLRFHSRGAGGVEPADLEDISSEKALELLQRAESGAWRLEGRTASEISGYVSSAARFGWIDFMQRTSREAATQVPEELSGETGRVISERPRALALIEALRSCVERLPARGRRVWFFRAYYGMSGREIAEHPLVRLNAAHVDVLVQRTRNALRECLRENGALAEDPPRGAFVELWELLESLATREEEPAALLEEKGRKGGRRDA